MVTRNDRNSTHFTMNLAETDQRQKPTIWNWTALAPVLPAIIVAYACILPRELAVSIGTIELGPFRLALLLVLPLVVRQFVKRPIRITFIDALAAFATVWPLVALVTVDTIDNALIVGVAQGADFALAYLTGRACLHSARDFKLFFAAFLPGIVATGVLLAVESISHRMLLRPLLAQILGQPRPELFSDVRLGLLRATGPFPHPILGGVLLASLLPMAWYATKTRRTQAFGIFGAFCCIFSVSSVALLALLFNFGLLVANTIQRVTRWPIFVVGALYAAFVGTAISLGSESGLISFLSRRVTLDPATARYRQTIWEYGGAEVMRNPIFGIGTRDWIRPAWMVNDSVDAHWLLMAMRYGLPMTVACFLLMAGAVYVVLRGTHRGTGETVNVGYAIGFALASIIFAGFTVFLWEGIATWMLLLTGAAVSIGTASGSAEPVSVAAPKPLTWQDRILGKTPGR